MQKLSLQLKKKKTIAFVPTMGYLHEGHLKLVKVAQTKADVVIASIFINPTQFGKNEDLSRYPQDLKGDLQKLKSLNVDYVFLPTAADIYPEGFQTFVNVEEMTQVLCGQSRPGHFRGVTTIVLKLFNIVQPDVAIFGKKDFQQFSVIKRMVKDLLVPVKILGVDTVREQDGLAMSSRNVYLSAKERELALGLSRSLNCVKKACEQKSLTAAQMKELFLQQLPKDEAVKLDYIECLEANDLSPIDRYQPKKTLLATAVFVGKTRLIDNLVF